MAARRIPPSSSSSSSLSLSSPSLQFEQQQHFAIAETHKERQAAQTREKHRTPTKKKKKQKQKMMMKMKMSTNRLRPPIDPTRQTNKKKKNKTCRSQRPATEATVETEANEEPQLLLLLPVLLLPEADPAAEPYPPIGFEEYPVPTVEYVEGEGEA